MKEILDPLFASLGVSFSEPYWRPSADIYRTKKGWLIKYDLAGVTTKDIAITVEGPTVTLDGCRRDWSLGEDLRHYAMEIAYSRFARTIQLPCDLERAQLKIQWRDGILLLRVLCQGEPS
ncbi:MAG TPA: Hsp20/alpha crystallin family protein [Candidatus Binatia bacterium]